MAAELTPGGVDSACHPSEVSEMSTSVLVEGHGISGTATLPRDDSYLAAKLPYARTEQNFSGQTQWMDGKKMPNV